MFLNSIISIFSIDIWKESFWDLVKFRKWDLKTLVLLCIFVSFGTVMMHLLGMTITYLFQSNP